MAAQTLYDEEYAKTKTGTAVTVETGEFTKAKIKSLSEVKGTVTDVTLDGNKIGTLTYDDGTNICVYNPQATDNTDGDYKVTAK